jgi:hypothetical protein
MLRFSEDGRIIPLRPVDSSPPGALAPPAGALTTITNINTPQKSSKNKRSWGLKQRPKKFTKRARDTIQEACVTLDRLYSRENLRFITITLPGSRHESSDVLSRWSGWFINRLKQVFRNWAKYHDSAHECFTWELQKRGALHLHWVVGCDNDIDILAHRLKDKWYDLLKEVGEKENIDMFARKGFGTSHKDNPDAWQWKIEKIEKSISRYLSKYTSKGFNQNSNKSSVYKGFQQKYSPSRWWGISQNLRKAIQKYRIELRFETLSTDECELFMNRLFSLIPKDAISYQYSFDWMLDIGISGTTKGWFIDHAVFEDVSKIVSDFALEWFVDIESSRRSENSLAMARRRVELWGDVTQNLAKFEALVMSSNLPIYELYGEHLSL